MLAIGLMSGTSMDGIDACLLETDGFYKSKLIASYSYKYNKSTHALLKYCEKLAKENKGVYSSMLEHFAGGYISFLDSMDDKQELEFLFKSSNFSEIDFNEFLKINDLHDIKFEDVEILSTLLHAHVVKQLILKNNINPQNVKIIGYHGQNLYHNSAEKTSLQIGDRELLMKISGINVFNDFRREDIKHGGQGAPLAPIYHHALAVRDNIFPCAVVNCGGISNISFIPSNNIEDVIGFDIGPGNVLIDRYLRKVTENKLFMDEDGKLGSNGQLHEKFLDLLYQTCAQKDNRNFFEKSPPKSADSYDFSILDEIYQLRIEDACRTLESFTSYLIANSTKFISEIPKKWILAGGGWKNPIILSELKRYLLQLKPDIELIKADEIGWSSDYMEAELFAYLAVRKLNNLPTSYAKISGASINT